MASDSSVPLITVLKSDVSEDNFVFRIPPEAPVFEPTHDEFKDPLLYINKIRPIAEKTGICKIRPPPNWQPPFAVDIENFKFTPRIQRLNELEAKTRIKLNFLDQIAKFWELQGSALKIPMVERRILDLYTLHQTVLEEGGAPNITKERKWNKVATKMGMPNNKGIGTLLRSHYERILYPFDLFQKSKLEGINENKSGHSARAQMMEDDKGQNNIHKILQKTSSVERKSVRRSTTNISDEPKRSENDQIEPIKNDSKELKRLQFYGAGPKMVGFNLKKEEKQPTKTRGKRSFIEYDPLAKYVCRHCQRGDIEESMLLCDGCDDSYHTFCLNPPLLEVPKEMKYCIGDWRCPKCVAREVNKPTEAFGFEQAQREYTLHQFGEMADQFKSDYFNMPVHKVPTSLVEKEFWRIVSSLDEDVTVEYGADLHTIDHGSGFPTKTYPNLAENPEFAQYAESSWNLNNLPVLEGSVLAYINADISGMKVPWMYVGMCFATFCWHNEDHWSYSINYLHWGEPKTWYGVPGSSAEEFERSMKTAAPELFHSQPDLLHQLVTIMNPNVLMSAGVPVYRTDQHAGEFVITFPRAYHAGFNQGYNFAEAVNFAPADWLKMGRECISHYSSLHRYCVFSHDELVCKMAVHSDSLDPRIAAATYQDMLQMVDQEKKLRKSLLEWGVCDAEREAFELLPDDERQCEVCKTTCFLSAVTCSCSTSHLVCLRHHTYLCDCPPKKHTLRYRYTLDELPIMLQKLKLKAESFDSWVSSVKDALDCTTPKALDLDGLKALLREAEEKKFPESELLKALGLAVQEAEKCSTVARQLEANRVRTRARTGQECQLTLEELYLFHDKIQGLACKIKEAEAMTSWVNETKCTSEDLKKLLVSQKPDLEELERVMNKTVDLNVRFPLLPRLQQKIVQVKWMRSAETALAKDKMSFEEIKDILLQHQEVQFSSSKSKLQELRAQLEQIQESALKWESVTKDILEKRCRKTLKGAEKLLTDGQKIKVILPSLELLEDVVTKGRRWTEEAQEILASHCYPSADVVKDIASRSYLIPLGLPLSKELKWRLKKARKLIRYTSSLFTTESSKYSLMEALCPRVDERNIPQSDEDTNIMKFQQFLKNNETENKILLSTFYGAQREEINNMKKVQLNNIHKKLQAGNLSQFCICLKKLSGKMVECSLCRDWFHEKCVPSLQSIKDKTDEFGCDIKFTCPYCARTRRPTIEPILSLLLSYKKVGVKLPEGEALRFLMDRILTWQNEVKETLKNEEMIQALAILEKRKKQKCSIEPQDSIKTPSELAPVTTQPTPTTTNEISTKWAVVKPFCPKEDYHQSEHTYSSASKLTVIKKHNRKSPIIPRVLLDDEDDSIICLSKGGIIAIKELLNEGGLIEATLEETQLLWCLLQNSVPHQVWRDFGDEEEQESSSSELKSDISDANLKKKGSESDYPVFKKPRILLRTKVVRTDGTSDQSKIFKWNKNLQKTKVTTKEDPEKKSDDDICAAPSCQKPKGTRVDWVQCDGSCDKWFHMKCVGILKRNLKMTDLYICTTCHSSKEIMDTESMKAVFISNRPAILSRKGKSSQKKTTQDMCETNTPDLQNESPGAEKMRSIGVETKTITEEEIFESLPSTSFDSLPSTSFDSPGASDKV